MGPGLHTYPWLVIKTAWRHSFHATHSIILALIMLAGLVTYFVPTVEVMVDLHGWQVATLVLGGVIAVRLFLSPYWIWKEDQKRLATLSGQIETEAEIKQKRTEKQAAVDDLSEEIRWATDNLVNPTPHPLRPSGNTLQQISDWSRDCDEWYRKINDKLSDKKIFTRSQQLHFDVLTKVEQVSSTGPVEFTQPYNVLHTKIIRLREIVADVSRRT